MDDNLRYINEELSREEDFVGDYSIKAKWSLDTDNPSRLMEVSRFFGSPEELEEAGITSESRLILAYSPLGYQQLMDMGFEEIEISKYYGDTNYSSDT